MEKSKECPVCRRIGMRGQGMVLEESCSDPTGGDLPKVPTFKYRCQDCGHEAKVLEPFGR